MTIRNIYILNVFISDSQRWWIGQKTARYRFTYRVAGA